MPVAEYSSLDGKFAREKVVTEKEDGGKLKKVKGMAYKFIVAGIEMPCPDELAMRILSGTDKSIFKRELEFRIRPEDFVVSEGGIPATVESVLDYGKEYFAKCKVGEATVLVKVEKGFDKQQVNLALNVSALSIIEKQRDIRLI